MKELIFKFPPPPPICESHSSLTRRFVCFFFFINNVFLLFCFFFLKIKKTKQSKQNDVFETRQTLDAKMWCCNRQSGGNDQSAKFGPAAQVPCCHFLRLRFFFYSFVFFFFFVFLKLQIHNGIFVLFFLFVFFFFKKVYPSKKRCVEDGRWNQDEHTHTKKTHKIPSSDWLRDSMNTSFPLQIDLESPVRVFVCTNPDSPRILFGDNFRTFSWFV